MTLLPHTPRDLSLPDTEPRVVELSSEEADDLMNVFGSSTARRILLALLEDVMSAPALADHVDSSLQNVHYHLNRLVDADVVEVVSTVYSEKGREMKLYGPAANPLVMWFGEDEEVDVEGLCEGGDNGMSATRD